MLCVRCFGLGVLFAVHCDVFIHVYNVISFSSFPTALSWLPLPFPLVSVGRGGTGRPFTHCWWEQTENREKCKPMQPIWKLVRKVKKKPWKYYKSSSTYHFEQYPQRTLSQHSTKAPARSHSWFVPTYWGNVHNSQVMKAATVPTNRWRDTKCCFISICQRQVRVLVSLKDNFSLFPSASLVLKWGH